MACNNRGYGPATTNRRYKGIKTMIDLMTQAFENAAANWEAHAASEAGKKFGTHVAIGVAGDVTCRITIPDHVQTARRESFRKNWEYKGKRISAAKLAAM